MKLGVVIVTYNRIELLKECIANCMNQVLKFDKIFYHTRLRIARGQPVILPFSQADDLVFTG